MLESEGRAVWRAWATVRTINLSADEALVLSHWLEKHPDGGSQSHCQRSGALDAGSSDRGAVDQDLPELFAPDYDLQLEVARQRLGPKVRRIDPLIWRWCVEVRRRSFLQPRVEAWWRTRTAFTMSVIRLVLQRSFRRGANLSARPWPARRRSGSWCDCCCAAASSLSRRPRERARMCRPAPW